MAIMLKAASFNFSYEQDQQRLVGIISGIVNAGAVEWFVPVRMSNSLGIVEYSCDSEQHWFVTMFSREDRPGQFIIRYKNARLATGHGGDDNDVAEDAMAAWLVYRINAERLYDKT